MSDLLSKLPQLPSLDFVGKQVDSGRDKKASKPAKILTDCKNILKTLFKFSQDAKHAQLVSTLDPECINTFDVEQVWALIQLDNDSVLRRTEKNIKKLKKSEDIRLTETKSHFDSENSENSESSDEDEGEGEEEPNEESSLSDSNKNDNDSDDTKNVDEDDRAKKLVKADRLEELAKVSDGSDAEEEDDEEDEDEEEDEEVTPVDDEFFKLREMDRVTEFFEEEEQKQNEMKVLYEKQHEERAAKRKAAKKEDDYSDSDDDDDDDDESEVEYIDNEIDDSDHENMGAQLKYEDFFGPETGSKTKDSILNKTNKNKKKNKRVRFDEHTEHVKKDTDEEEESDAEPEVESETVPESEELSSYEIQQKQLEKKLRELEEKALEEKSWDMKGETMARSRPENSLLEKGDLDVQYISTPAPTVTEEVTESIEDIIRRRVADGDYDDVVRKLPMEQRADYKPKIELSTEKSKQGLGDVYAKEYEENVLGNKSNAEIKYTEEQQEIKDLFSKLVHKLDALSNFYYTPKPPQVDGGVKRLDVASINMEEATPAAMSSASQLAPEEVYAMKKGKAGLGKSNEELEKEDRKRLRQEKKTAKRKRKRQREAERKVISKLNPGLGNKYAKEKAIKNIQDDKNVIKSVPGADLDVKFTKSTQFFKHLQERSDGLIAPMKAKKSKTNSSSSYML